MDLRCGEGRSQAVMAAYHALCNVRLMVEKDLRLNLTNHETGIADTEKPHGRGDRQEGSPGAYSPVAGGCAGRARI